MLCPPAADRTMSQAILDDLNHALRRLWSKPAFAIAVVLTLALGIGCNTAVFSVIQGLLLRPLPYSQSERLVHVYNTYPKMGVEFSGMTVPDYVDRRDQATALAQSAIYHEYSFDLAERGPPQRVVGIVASPSLFTTLGVQAEIGRTFVDDEAVLGHERVVLLSHGLWRDEFGANPSVVGRDIRISGQPYRVVGVMAASFVFPRSEIALWVPFAFSERQKSDSMRGLEFAESIGRLAPGASIEQLTAQFDAIVARNLEHLSPEFKARVADTGFAGRARPLREQLAGDVDATLWLLQAAVALVLLIACANVANLMLVQLSSRQRELHTRAALGATHARLAQQMLVESLVLATGGGIVGIGVAYAGIELIRALGLDGAANGFSIGLQLPVLGFALASMLVSALFFGVLPIALLRTGRTSERLKEGGRGGLGSRSTRTSRNALVVLQVGLAVALLIGAGLLVNSLLRVQQQSPGFDSEHLVTVSLHLSRDRYREPAQTLQFHDRLLEAVRGLPGVRSASSAGGMLFSSDYDSGQYLIEGRETAGKSNVGYLQPVDKDFFSTLGIPLLSGRSFVSSDASGAPVAIIDERLAKKVFGDQSPLGTRLGTIGIHGTDWHTIVGVVASVKRKQLSEVDGMETYYFPYRPAPPRIFRLAVRTDVAASQLIAPIRAALQRIDPEQPIFDVMSMHERIDRSLDERRTITLLLSIFAGIAFCLCAVGIHGVLAFAVAQRSGEIGVRRSLGASRADVMRLVLANAARLAVVGIACGIALALVLEQPLRAWLFGVDVLDPATSTAVVALVAAMVLLASWIPARRAGSISPMEALREE
jgi:predicted permease